MHFLEKLDVSTGHRHLVIQHGQKQVSFNVAAFAKPTRHELVVSEINRYWETLPQNVHAKLFALYEEAYKAVEEIESSELLMLRLRSIVRSLSEAHEFEKLSQFTKVYGKVKLPPELQVQYGIEAPNTPLTYLRGEYVDLLTLSIQHRFCVPLWGAYMFRIKDETQAQFKELAALQLITTSHLVQSPAYKRLQLYISEYIRNSNPNDLKKMAILVNNLGTAQLPDWLLAQILIRRLSVAELVTTTMPDPAKSLVSDVYNYLRQRIERIDRTFTDQIRDKNPDGNASQSDEQRASTAEGYKIKEEQTVGTILAYSVYLMDLTVPLYQVALKIEPTLPEETLAVFHSRNRDNPLFDLADVQMTLIAWVIHKVVTARAVQSLEPAALRNACSIVQAVLWHWGFHELAILAGSKAVQLPGGLTSMGAARQRITREQQELLAAHYPHYQQVKTKGGNKLQLNTPEGRLQAAIQNNVAIQAIHDIVDLFNLYAWKPDVPKEFLSAQPLQWCDAGLLVSSRICQDLANLVLKIQPK